MSWFVETAVIGRGCAAMGEEAFAAAWAEGDVMSFDEAGADALALEAAPCCADGYPPWSPASRKLPG